MKKIKKTIVLVAIVAAAVGGYQGYKAYNKSAESTLLMQNVEALSDEEGGGDTSWYLHHFACSFTVATKAQATFYKRKSVQQ